MNETPYQTIHEEIEKAEFVLVGIGEEFQADSKLHTEEELLRAYASLDRLISGKPYFVVTQNEDKLIFQSELLDFFITAPFAKGKPEQNIPEQWNAYLNWLTATLNHRLCMLELGVGFSAPQVIRFPFERTAAFHLKSRLIRVNETFWQLPDNIGDRGISIWENAVSILKNDLQSTGGI